MGFFDNVYIKDVKTGDIVNIVNLDKEHYESFLDAMYKLRLAYNVAIKRQEDGNKGNIIEM